jgi:hypothetical protein
MLGGNELPGVRLGDRAGVFESGDESPHSILSAFRWKRPAYSEGMDLVDEMDADGVAGG